MASFCLLREQSRTIGLWLGRLDSVALARRHAGCMSPGNEAPSRTLPDLGLVSFAACMCGVRKNSRGTAAAVHDFTDVLVQTSAASTTRPTTTAFQLQDYRICAVLRHPPSVCFGCRDAPDRAFGCTSCADERRRLSQQVTQNGTHDLQRLRK